MSSTTVSLNPLLRSSQYDLAEGHCCLILWDIREPPLPSARHVFGLEFQITPSVFDHYATTPPVPSLSITCDFLPVPWPMVAANANGVTIRDVLEAIYHALSTPLQSSVVEPLSLKQQRRIYAAFDARRRALIALTNIPVDQRSLGLLRVDTLLRHTLFAGLTLIHEDNTEHRAVLTLRRPT